MRLAASLQDGTVAPSAMLRKLAAYRRQNQLDLALQELGRIERTLFTLDWLESPKLRRLCHAGLNKSEQRHFLYWNTTYIADAVAHLRASKGIDDGLLAHTSPLTWEHISFSGDFLWERAAAAAGNRRPLNLGRVRQAA